MNKIILASLVSMLIVPAVNATTIDYRHEYLQETGQNADRVRVSNRFDNNLGFAVEAKWKSGGDYGLYEDMYSSGHETELNYLLNPMNGLAVTPAVVIDSNSDSTIFKAQVKAIYDVTDAFYFGGRYRYGYQNYNNTTGTKENNDFNQINLYLGYKFSWGTAEYDFEYVEKDYNVLRGDTSIYVHNLVVNMPINASWVPFVELGYVPFNNPDEPQYEEGGDNDFQVRYRVGIKYNF